ncbi:VanZ family protein [Conyzicola sp.]|uniref:VanZ family protein n=1 Tax=Conyzicola sp. TaxID=1969404 RepID=UPI003989F8D8
MFRRHPIVSVVTLAYLGTLAWLTLTPSNAGVRTFSLLQRVARSVQSNVGTEFLTFGRVEFAANVALFVPMGVFVLLLLGRRLWWVGVFAGLLASCWIELAQGVWLSDRVSDPRDLLSNGLGTVVGVLLALLVTWPAAHRLRQQSRARAARQSEA